MDFQEKQVLITVKTYPSPAKKGIEVSCTAGITENGEWIRLFPMPFRFLGGNKQFKKYQWIDVKVKKASDPRKESYIVDLDSIKIPNKNTVSTLNAWEKRKDIIYPLKSQSLCQLMRDRKTTGQTLGFFKPKTIRRLVIEKEESPEWTPQQQSILSQESHFDSRPFKILEKIPYKFSYEFTCSDDKCLGHKLSVTDWEIHAAYRDWSRKYGREWDKYFIDRFETDMAIVKDTHFFVGTIKAHPHIWTIIGLFYPPKLP